MQVFCVDADVLINICKSRSTAYRLLVWFMWVESTFHAASYVKKEEIYTLCNLVAKTFPRFLYFRNQASGQLSSVFKSS